MAEVQQSYRWSTTTKGSRMLLVRGAGGHLYEYVIHSRYTDKIQQQSVLYYVCVNCKHEKAAAGLQKLKLPRLKVKGDRVYGNVEDAVVHICHPKTSETEAKHFQRHIRVVTGCKKRRRSTPRVQTEIPKDEHSAFYSELPPPEESYGENKAEYIIPNVADGSAPSTSSALEPSPSLILSDVRSLADSPEGTPVQIKEELAEETMEEENLLVPDCPSPPSSGITDTPFATSPSADTKELIAVSETPVVIADTTPAVVPTALVETPEVPTVSQAVPQTQPTQQPPRASVPVTDASRSLTQIRKRQATPWTPPPFADRKAKAELELLYVKRKKLEAEEQKAAAETLRMMEERKKFEEEQRKLKAEAEFYIQEKIRSIEETRKATAIAEYHFEEKRKAAAKADMLTEHKKFYIEQQKTEIVRRRMLLLEMRKMKQDLKLLAD